MDGSEATIGLVADVQPERSWLDDRSWVDLWPGWMGGADPLYAVLREQVAFRESRIYRYDHWVVEPRLVASLEPAAAPHPALLDAQRTIQHHYGVRFGMAAVGLYRDGRDSVAFHRDRDLQWLDDTAIALLVLGERRPFHLRPRANRYDHEAPDRGATVRLAPGHGDLLVMGGGCQAGWEHSVPKVPSPIGGRMSVQWRWTSRRGRMERGGSYRAPRHYGRG